jgi:hypothetical protein
LDWVFGTSGIRQKLLFSDEGLQSYQILSSGTVQFTTDGVRSVDGYREFPYTGIVSFDGKWGNDGQAADYDPYGAGETPTVERYWAERTETTAFGMAGRSEAVLDAQIDIAGLEMVFGPVSGQDFDAAFCAPPGVEISCE